MVNERIYKNGQQLYHVEFNVTQANVTDAIA